VVEWRGPRAAVQHDCAVVAQGPWPLALGPSGVGRQARYRCETWRTCKHLFPSRNPVVIGRSGSRAQLNAKVHGQPLQPMLRKREVEAVNCALQFLNTFLRDKLSQRRTQVLEAVDGGGIEVREQFGKVLQGVRDLVADGGRGVARRALRRRRAVWPCEPVVDLRK